MKINTIEKQTFTIVSVDLEGESITPQQLGEIDLPSVRLNLGIILDGRAPIWLHAYLASKYSPALWIALNDPKLGGGVVVRSHRPGIEIGSIQQLD